MTYDADRHHRRSIRLRGYDYAGPGSYFVTICTHDRAPIFGDVVAGAVALNDVGRIVQDEWQRSAEIRPNLRLDAFVLMPNHLHGIVTFVQADFDPLAAHLSVASPSARANSARANRAHGDGAHGDVAHCSMPLRRPPHSLGSFVAGLKAASTKRINLLRETPGAPVWQRNYYEHIIRSEQALVRIYNYIMTNPLRWMLDRENPDRWDIDDFDLWLDDQPGPGLLSSP